jgi:hypothetical protein
MPHARDHAITALSELVVNPAEKIVISDRYGITAWTEPALVQLVDRDQPLSVADIECIGISRAANVAARREQILIRPTFDVPCRCDVEAGTTRQTTYYGHSEHALSSSTCTCCRKECLQSTLCRNCQTIRCSNCRKCVGVVENVIGRPKISRLTIRRMLGGWDYDALKFHAFRLMSLALQLSRLIIRRMFGGWVHDVLKFLAVLMSLALLASFLTIRHMFRGWVYGVSNFLAFRLISLASLVFVVYKLYKLYDGL